MRIKIVIDIWRDVFDFLSLADRKQLALKFNELGDREFSDLCQKWLHEWTKNVCFHKIFIGPFEVNRPFADVELPDNVQTFKAIRLWQIGYLETPALHFLQRLQPLFHDVILEVYCTQFNLVPAHNVLDSVLPLLSSIEMLSLGDTLASTSLLFTIRDFPNQFFGIKRLHIHLGCEESLTEDGELMELVFLWLGTRRADGQPRTLILTGLGFFNRERVENIRQRFLNSTSPASFFIRIPDTFFYEQDIQASITQNAKTHEQLLVRPSEDYDEDDKLLIGRCSSDELDGPKWVEEMDKIVDEQDKQPMRRKISIDLLLDWDSDEVESVSDEEEDVDQPGPSNKKPKLT